MMAHRAVLVFVCVLWLGACGSPDPAPDAPVLARVGDEVVTVSEFEAEMARRGRVQPVYFQRAGNRRALLEEMLRHRMLVAEARRMGIDQEPDFRELVERMLIQRLRERRLDEALSADEIGDEDVAAFYERNREEFTRPARRQVALIRVDIPAGADPEDRQERRDRIEAARAAAEGLDEDTAHFGAVAVEYSDDRSSRYQGGVVGWLVDHPERHYQWPPEVLEAAFALDAPGQITSVIETGQAFYLVRLVAFEPERRQPLEQVADGIRHRLRRERARELESEVFRAIEQGYETRIDEALLGQVAPPESLAVPPERRAERPPALPDDTGETTAAEPEQEQD